jgi:hypothetical protein
MKTRHPGSQNLAWGDPMFNQGRYVHTNQFSTSCLSLLNKIKTTKIFASTMCLKSCLYTLTLEMMNGCYVKTLQEPSAYLCALCLFEFVGII